MSSQSKYRYLEVAYPDMLNGIGVLIQKGKVANRFEGTTIDENDIIVLDKAKHLCELRIVELWDNQNSEEFKALCSTYFDIATQIEIDIKEDSVVFEYLKTIAFGYLGEGWHLVRQYLKKEEQKINNIPNSEKWNSRLLNTSFKAIIGLVRKQNWRDINTSVEFIEKLRLEQNEFEQTFLNNVDESGRPYGAAELVSLYHFAKSIEILGEYLIGGRPLDAENQVKYHVGYSKDFAVKAENISLQLLIQFFESFASKLIKNTIWYNTKNINSRISKFNKFISRREDFGIFELLYPQKESLNEIFNPAHSAIVVNLPTSSGKTMIAEYRLLAALNQFAEDGGWVAYVVPTRSLVNQTYNQLNKDLSGIGIRVEKVSGTLDLDGFEETLLEGDAQSKAFDVLVTTYEKLHLMIRQGYGTSEKRPLVLAIVDEAHNIEDEVRGLNLEFLLSTIKTDCANANFLLMTPDVSNSEEIAKWLGGERGRDVHLSLHWWQPNERVVGALIKEGSRRNYEFKLKTLLTNKGTYLTEENIKLADSNQNDPTTSKLNTKKLFASTLAAKLLDIKEPTIILAGDPSSAFDIANNICSKIENEFENDPDVELIRRFIEDELGTDFPLSSYLSKRVGVHSSAIPDEIKFLLEGLMSKGKLQALVATTTIAQGINFPISSVIMATYRYPFKLMPIRDFWNLAGRVGRAGQQSLGWVGLIAKDDEDLLKITNYVKNAADDLESQLISIVNQALSDPTIEFERWLFRDPRWSGLLQYISHLYNQSENLSSLIANLEQKLQDTLGFKKLNQQQKNYLRTNLRAYINKIKPLDAKLSDATGFSTVSIRNLLGSLSGAGLKSSDWERNQLFSNQNKSLQKLIGMMFKTPEIRKSIEKLSNNSNTIEHVAISKMVVDWVNGKSIKFIADKYFSSETDSRKRIEKCTRAMYSYLPNAATWGLSAIQKMPNSGADWENLSDVEKKRMANLPALIHYGVNTDEAVLMRKNNIPRSIAKKAGELYNASIGGEIFQTDSNNKVVQWLSSLEDSQWNSFKSSNSKMTGAEYKKIWEKLNGLQ